MDYQKIATDALRERAEIFEKRKALFDSDATDAEKREQAERMDADMDALAAKAGEAVREGEREGEIRDLTARAGAIGTPAADEVREQEGPTFEDSLRAVGLGELRSFDFSASAEAFEGRATTKVSNGAGANKLGTAGPVTPDTFVATLIEYLEESSDVLARVKKISTSSGEPMNWPRRVDKVTNTFQALLEAGQYPSTVDGSFDLFTLGAKKFGAIGEISEEALTDPALNVGAIVAQEMGEDLADTLAAQVWTGTQLGENILDNGLHVTTLTGAGNVSPTFDDLIDLQHSITAKYRRNASWTVNDLTARDLRKVKDANENYIWQAAVVAGQPDMLLGKPVATDPEVPALTVAGKAGVFFGDLQRAYILRTVRAISLVRSTEYGFDRDTVALKVKWRGDGAVYDPNSFALLKPSAT